MGTHPIFESDFDCLTEDVGYVWCVFVAECGGGVWQRSLLPLVSVQARQLLDRLLVEH